jgi:hypothetical protein
MTTLSLAVRDSNTMLRRNLLRMRRYPSLTFMLIGMPVIFLLLFVYVFGGTLGNGLGGTSGGRGAYANYVVPGILLMAVAGTAQGTALSIAMDMTEGIIARFRTMGIFRPSVLTGHVLGAVIQTMLGLVVVVAIALLVGFRPNANLIEWVAATGVLAMIAFALTWLSVALGLVAKSVETASTPAHAADAATVPRQRLRAHRLDARRGALVRRVPAVHTRHGNPSRPVARHRYRRQRRHRGRLVRRDNRGLLLLGQSPVQPLRCRVRRWCSHWKKALSTGPRTSGAPTWPWPARAPAALAKKSLGRPLIPREAASMSSDRRSAIPWSWTA